MVTLYCNQNHVFFHKFYHYKSLKNSLGIFKVLLFFAKVIYFLKTWNKPSHWHGLPTEKFKQRRDVHQSFKTAAWPICFFLVTSPVCLLYLMLCLYIELPNLYDLCYDHLTLAGLCHLSLMLSLYIEWLNLYDLCHNHLR